MDYLKEASWLKENIDCVRAVDATFFEYGETPKAIGLFKEAHIKGAVFYDIDTVTNPAEDYYHMMPTEEVFDEYMRSRGFSIDDTFVLYDNSSRFTASCRAFWVFKSMGIKKVYVLQGGLDAWKAVQGEIETGDEKAYKKSEFKSTYDDSAYARLEDVKKAMADSTVIVDTRKDERFFGDVQEPRPAKRLGHIPGAKCIIIPDVASKGYFKSVDEIKKVFEAKGVNLDKDEIIFSCGSAMTAPVVYFAALLAGANPSSLRVYDRSWQEWGNTDGCPVEGRPVA